MNRARVFNWYDIRLVYNELRLTISGAGLRTNN